MGSLESPPYPSQINEPQTGNLINRLVSFEAFLFGPYYNRPHRSPASHVRAVCNTTHSPLDSCTNEAGDPLSATPRNQRYPVAWQHLPGIGTPFGLRVPPRAARGFHPFHLAHPRASTHAIYGVFESSSRGGPILGRTHSWNPIMFDIIPGWERPLFFCGRRGPSVPLYPTPPLERVPPPTEAATTCTCRTVWVKSWFLCVSAIPLPLLHALHVLVCCFFFFFFFFFSCALFCSSLKKKKFSPTHPESRRWPVCTRWLFCQWSGPGTGPTAATGRSS